MKRAPLTMKQFLGMNSHSNGWGYLCHEIRLPWNWQSDSNPYRVTELLDQALINRANKLHVSIDQLFAYVDSSSARHDADTAFCAKIPEKAAACMADGLEKFIKAAK